MWLIFLVRLQRSTLAITLLLRMFIFSWRGKWRRVRRGPRESDRQVPAQVIVRQHCVVTRHASGQVQEALFQEGTQVITLRQPHVPARPLYYTGTYTVLQLAAGWALDDCWFNLWYIWGLFIESETLGGRGRFAVKQLAIACCCTCSFELVFVFTKKHRNQERQAVARIVPSLITSPARLSSYL